MNIVNPSVPGTNSVNTAALQNACVTASKLAALAVTNPAVAGLGRFSIITASGTFTPSVTGNHLIIIVGGGSGGGGGGAADANAVNRGMYGEPGRCGQVNVAVMALTAAIGVSVTIGAGGAGGAQSSANAQGNASTAGGATSFGANTAAGGLSAAGGGHLMLAPNYDYTPLPGGGIGGGDPASIDNVTQRYGNTGGNATLTFGAGGAPGGGGVNLTSTGVSQLGGGGGNGAPGMVIVFW